MEDFYVCSGIFGIEFYNDFVKEHLPYDIREKFRELLIDEEYYIDFQKISYSTKDDNPWEFSLILLCDINLDTGFYPVMIENINSSSTLALTLCGMEENCDDYDYDSDDSNERKSGYKTIEEIICDVCEEHKEQVFNILEKSMKID